MELIKKNVVLFTALGITLVIVGVLVYLVMVTHGSMGEYIDKVNSLRDTIKVLGKKSPRPVKENIIRIEKDIIGYTNSSNEIVKMFGQPTYPALLKFCEVLQIKPEVLREELRTFWNEKMQRGSGITSGLVLRNFNTMQQKKYGKEKWEKALDIFQSEIEKVTYEVVNKDNVKDILFQSLGLPRQVKRVQCLTHMVKMREKLWALLQEKNVFVTKEASGLTFTDNEYKELPKEFDVPDIFFSWSIIEDIVSRIANSGVKQVSVFSKRGLGGYKEGDYTYYRFNLTVHGSENSIRKLVNNLYKAYNERRVYIVREISLKRDVDMADEILKSTVGVEYRIDETRRSGNPAEPGMDGFAGNTSGVESADSIARKKLEDEKRTLLEQEEKKLPFYQRKSYGRVILGQDLVCEATIAIDYVVYNGFKISQELK